MLATFVKNGYRDGSVGKRMLVLGNFPGSKFLRFNGIPETKNSEAVSDVEQKRRMLKDVFCSEKNIAAPNRRKYLI